MSAEELLRASERSASIGTGSETQIVSRVVGKFQGSSKSKKIGSFGVIGLITMMIVVLAVMFSFGNLIPAAILERLVEATDVQYADAVESKFLVFQQALESGDIPKNTEERLKANGITVEGTSLSYRGESIPAANFINKIHSDASFYEAFNNATYNRAAYYYDESAEKVFKKIGTSRNNYTATSEFDSVMSELVGEGSSVTVNNVGLFEKEDEDGNKYTVYDTVDEKASSSGDDAKEFIKKVAKTNQAENALTATLNATDALNVADTTSKEQKSSIFFMALMENISKMKAGQGNTSKINEAMNFLYKEQESEVVDVKTGEIIKVKGSALEAPSLYAILSGSKVDGDKVKNYASDRVLKTVENKVGVGEVGKEVKEGTVASITNKIKGAIGRFLPFLGETADDGILSSVEPTINSSMMENSFENIGGIYSGELLVEGAVNVGKELAKASGATPGDKKATENYARLNSDILALDAEVDRNNRSPFDVTSKNTFLGSIVHKLATNNIITVLSKSFGEVAHADDKSEDYLSNYGNCETLGLVGAVGTVGCSEIATFDTSTLNNTFNDAKFKAFVEENTTLGEDGKRTINKDSVLADFIKYNNERITPVGVIDGGILESIKTSSSGIPFVSNIIGMIENFLGASDEDKAIANGRSFVNSTSNTNWEKYKYAQRYISLARATDALRQYDGDETAYNNLKYFEGDENPVIAFLNDYYSEIANK
ncbi:hypothetical protein IKF84_03255 [Candidatus Saccharibacteria bacterium]|nr:hypothetical protein [Candidatus Saccharibacteria bacterium]